jgi:hypothetical protein
MAPSADRIHHPLPHDNDMNPSATALSNPAPVDKDLPEHLMERLQYDRPGGPEVVHLSTFALADPAMLKSVEQGGRLHGKAVVVF